MRCPVRLFDVPNTEPAVPALVPVADWSRIHIHLDGKPLLLREDKTLYGKRTLDMRRGLLVSAWTHRTAADITVAGREILLLSLGDRAIGMQLQRLTIDRDGVEVCAEANFALAGLGMDPERLEDDLGAWRTEGSVKSVAMTGHAALDLDGEVLGAERPFPLRWVWRWRSVVGQVAEFSRLIAVARADTREEDPARPARNALERNLSLGWRAVLEAHETAWKARWAGRCGIQSAQYDRLELLLFRSGSHPRQHMLEWRSRDPEIAAEWVAEGDNQDEHQDTGSGQHSRHCELHPQARRTEERTEGDRQSPADDHHEPDDVRNGGLCSEQSLLSRVPYPLNRLKQKRMQVAISLAGWMKCECHLVQFVEVDRVLIDHASFRLCRPFNTHNASGILEDRVPDRRLFGICKTG
jgi:hypothetical protein